MDSPNPTPTPATTGVDTAALLEQLADVAVPDPPPWFPPAPGWWVLAAIVLSGFFFAFRYFDRRRKANLYRKEAAALLDSIYREWTNDCDDRAYAIAAHQLVRRVAIHVDGRESIARRTGAAFVESINALSTAPFSKDVGVMLCEAAYRPEADLDIEALNDAAGAWLARLDGSRRA